MIGFSTPDAVLARDEFDLSDELNAYFQNKFCAENKKEISFSTDEAYLNSWESYCLEANTQGVLRVLQKCYPQLGFSIQHEINKTQVYIDAVLKGKNQEPLANNELGLDNPAGLEIEIFASVAGRVPVLKVANSQDFTKIVQCLLHKNNPVNIPQSMGALLANGINNWERIHTLKQNWMADNPFGNWNQEFSNNVLPNGSLYKDKIIILSKKPYSNVASENLGIADEVWKSYSLQIRLEHECTHLYTLKRYGFATNNLHDELVADYIGISKAIGYYNKNWMLAFMGLENYPVYRKGARLENYLGDSNLSAESFDQLTMVIRNAIENIAIFDAHLGKINSANDHRHRIESLCETDVLKMASEAGARLLIEKYEELV